MSEERERRREIVEVCRRMYARGLIAGAEGNVSARLENGAILVTPRGAAKGELGPGDLVLLDPQRGHVARSGRASSELGMHLRIYARRTDVRAVVHAHPPVATGFAVAGEDLLTPVLPEIILQTGGVPLIPYATPGTESLADAFEPYLPYHDAFLMANHGATTVGPTLGIAYQRLEALEHAARTLLAARLLGRVNPLPDAEARALGALFDAARRTPVSAPTEPPGRENL